MNNMNEISRWKGSPVWRILTLMILLIFSSHTASSQTRQVQGTVRDQDGKPLAGVSVSVVESQKQTFSDGKGNFSIAVKSSDKSLTFSYVGYEGKIVALGDRTQLQVSLAVATSQMDEVVIIGYGTAQRKDLTGSVGSVKIEDLQKAPVKTFDEALAGRVAGVQVSSAEGQPGSSIDITIRGNNSITQSNFPLFVIDGFPFESAGDQSINPINTIDPGDIESIDVLKDASATAIYGARGANGVIIVTTKRGKVGKPVLTFNTYYGLQENNKRLQSLDPYEFVRLQNEIDSVRTRTLYFQDGRNLDYYRTVKGINWEDEITRVAPMQNHYFNIAGGTDKTKYSTTLSYTGQDGVLINSGFKRILGKMVLDQQVNDKLKVGMNASYSYIKTFGTPTSASGYVNETNMLFSVWSFRPLSIDPTLDLINEPVDPEVEQGNNNTFNPILTARNELRENYGGSLNTNAYLEYEINKYLKLRLAGGYNQGQREYDVFNGRFSRSGFISNFAVSGSKSIFMSSGWQNANTLTYARRLNKNHYFDLMVGFSAESGKSRLFNGSAILLPNESLGLNGLGEGIPNAVGAGSSEWALASFMGRLNYKLLDRFIFTTTLRVDGSSRFLGDNIWGYFPSAAAAWQMDKEEWLKSVPAISTSKLRLSWGVTGNNAVSNFAAYPAMAAVNTDAGNFYNNFPGYTFGGGYSNGLANISIGNPNLKWESTSQIDIGYNLGLFKDKLTVEVDVYDKKTSNLLLNADMSPNTGYYRSIKNIGKVGNRGLEITLSYSPVVKKDFSWNTSFNIAFNRNKVLSLAENQNYLLTSQGWGDDWKNIPGYVAKIGEPIGMFYGYIYEGVYKYGDFNKVGDNYVLKDNVTSNNASGTSVQPGDIKYRDLNGDYIINEADKTVIGNPNPIHIGGFSNNFSYKGFDLNVFLQWSYGNDILNANRIVFESAYKYGYNQWATYADRWTPENPDSDIPGVAAIKGNASKAYSTRVVEDGSFLRLKTVALGYNFKKEFLQGIKLKTLRIYASAQNLVTWTKYSGYDPEVSVRRSALTPGFDFSAYPRARTITVGLNTTF
ncbi:Outer membrane cobalamin receptor protein [Sphingobacterium spiritivorum]|uniref:Outer membrane cobalamin receptor protein n=2 Tax=Sphingobacterium spiritivorum TaxID=258 RepID=A0A380CK60_SPHSI|nr:Outer membrane cobalamin receptor protein [Sphingobacterium spiritivorum]